MSHSIGGAGIGSIVGMVLGGVIGSVVPGIGTALGAMAGSALGGVAGEAIAPPSAPKAPAVAGVITPPSVAAAQPAGQNELMSQSQMFGQASTVLTSGQGAMGLPTTAKKTLLGS